VLENKTVAVGVCGGIAAYKTCELVSLLKKAGAQVHVIMTKNAVQFVNPLTFETLSNNFVITDMFAAKKTWEVEHVSLAKKADIFVVAPATANVVGKIANGICDDMLTTTILATKAPILLAPAMNCNMLTNEAYVQNIKVCLSRKISVIDGGEGLLACGDIGVGRMAEPKAIFERIVSMLLTKNDYSGKKVLITAGATIENIDGVRFITNYSSGKMGCEIAQNAIDRGASVTLILGRHSVEPPKNADIINVETTAQMYQTVLDNVEKNDVIIKAAAPCDYAPVFVSEQKIKSEQLTLTFKKNPDIAKAVGKIKGDRVLVVFAAETDNLKANAAKKLAEKNADFIVANDVTQKGAGFNADTNIVSIIDKNGFVDYPIMTKKELAAIILDKAKTYLK
jgi:phosphopantothenoylcysteine decarboxylase/phosphopantothenate--cysteine ligase